jgi:DoxX-like family
MAAQRSAMARRWPAVRLPLTWLLGAVWLYQGAWAKVAGAHPVHTEIVASVPLVGPGRARPATVALGLAESAMTAWVVSRRSRRAAAVAQTALIVSMNAGGWWFARDRLDHPRRLWLRNALLVAAIWTAASGGRGR